MSAVDANIGGEKRDRQGQRGPTARKKVDDHATSDESQFLNDRTRSCSADGESRFLKYQHSNDGEKRRDQENPADGVAARK